MGCGTTEHPPALAGDGGASIGLVVGSGVGVAVLGAAPGPVASGIAGTGADAVGAGGVLASAGLVQFAPFAKPPLGD